VWAGGALTLLAAASRAQCNGKPAPSPSAEKVNVVLSERLFSATNRNDVVGAMKIWSDLIGCLTHNDVDTKVVVLSTPQELRQSVIEQGAQVLVLDGVEFLDLSEKGLVEGVGVASGDGRPLTPRYGLLVNSQVDALAQLRGKRATFYLRTSSAASVAWTATLLAKNRLGSIESFFGASEVSTKSTNCILPLFFGRIDACVVDSRSWETARELNPQIGNKLKMLAQSVPVMEGVTAVPKLSTEDRRRVVAGVLEMHKFPAGEQILTVFHTGPMIPYRPEYLESTRQFWNEYEQTLTPAQLKQWKQRLLPILPAPSRAPSGMPGEIAASR
jgi:phosphonate transport system substrate-binding protein